MTTVQSAYGSQTPEFGGTQTQTTESFFEANRPKNKGAIYTFDGVTYENDKVTGKPSPISE